MAADVLANITAALSQTFAKRLVKAWNRQAILLSQIAVVSDQGQGDAKQIAWDVAFSGATAASFVEGSDIQPSEYNQDPDVPAVLPWGQYRAPFKLSNLEINAASRSVANAVQLANLVMLRLEGSITKMLSVMNTDAFTGTGTDGGGNPNMVGLSSALQATGTYATIARASFSVWAANVLANGGIPRPLTFDLLANLEQLIFVASGQEPDALVTSPGVARKYEGLFETRRQTFDTGSTAVASYQGSTSTGVTGPRTNLYWRGKPVIRDRNCPAGTLYMLKWSELEMKYLPFSPLSPDGVPAQNTALPSSDGTNSAPTNIQATVYPLARTGSSVAFVAEVYTQLKVARPNAHGVLSDISEV
jgi:hypothetical protein